MRSGLPDTKADLQVVQIAYFTFKMITDGTLFVGAAATPLRWASEPRRGRRCSMKYPG
jgi:hypothetical protein